MKKQYLEAGEIVNTHGVAGEVKIDPWANDAKFLLGFKTIYMDGRPVKVLRARVHKAQVIASLEGVDTMDKANALRGKVISIDRADAKLDADQVFFQDIIGLTAVDAVSGSVLGRVTDILELPAGNVYVVSGETEHLVPAVKEFVKDIDVDGGKILLQLIEGM